LSLFTYVEWHFIGGFADVMGTEWKGRDGVLRFWRDWLGTIGGQVTLETTLDAGDRVVVIATVETAGAASGAPSTIRFGQVWSLARRENRPGRWLLRPAGRSRSRRAR
jgi:ketosteroid isomerase-like protein